MQIFFIVLLLLYAIVSRAEARRFLLKDDPVEFDPDKTIKLPGVFSKDMILEVNNEQIILPSEVQKQSETYFITNEESGDSIMFGSSESGDGHLIGAFMRNQQFYNIQPDGQLTELDLSNLTLIDPEEELNPLNHTRPPQPQNIKINDFNEANVIKFNPGCWRGDTIARELIIGVLVDRSYSMAFGENPSVILKEIQKIITSARLIMFLQLNIILTVGEVVIGGKDSPSPLNEIEVQSIRSSPYLLDPLRNMVSLRQKTDLKTRKASWHMLTNRWPSPGIVGMAYLGTLCMYDYNVGITSKLGPDTTWYIWIHELGHSMGAFHSFENGQGRTGGIMDYGNYYYNGVVQFHPLKRAEMCPEFDNVLTCPYFDSVVREKRCGDKILNEEEQCECLDGSTSCSGCKNCTAEDLGVECSAEVFVFRQRNMTTTVAVSESSLAQKGCCKNKRFVSVLDSQCDGNGGTCEFGYCQYRCKKYQVPACALINDGCTIPCILYGNDCSIDLKTSSGVDISKITNGVRCLTDGVCNNGKCINSTETGGAGSSRPPTLNPTRRRRRKRTAFPTRSPTTQSPTKSPTTKKPTMSPTEFPTESPTCCECSTRSPTTEAPTLVKNETKDGYEYYL